MYFDQGIGHR